MTTTTKTGWAAGSRGENGEWHSLCGGWPTEAAARDDLAEQGADLTKIDIYHAVTSDNWDTWDRS